MGGEVYAFWESFDEDFIPPMDLEMILSTKQSLQIFTDSNLLFNFITKALSPTENRYIIYIAAFRQAYRVNFITQVGIVITPHNPSDSISKVKDNGTLDNIIHAGRDNFPSSS